MVVAAGQPEGMCVCLSFIIGNLRIDGRIIETHARKATPTLIPKGPFSESER